VIISYLAIIYMITSLPDELILHISRYMSPRTLSLFVSTNSQLRLPISLRRLKLHRINRENKVMEALESACLYNLCASFVQRITLEVLQDLISE
jgi:ubiquitin C-terminal hydrolase